MVGQRIQCTDCSKYNIKPDSRFTTCFTCAQAKFRECPGCKKRKIPVNSPFDMCYGCNKGEGCD